MVDAHSEIVDVGGIALAGSTPALFAIINSMKVIIQYQCEICGKKHDSQELAKECEARGVFDNSIYPPGLMYPYRHHDLIGIFAIPEKIPFYEGNKHLGNSASWACRNIAVGDSLGDEVCGGDFYRSDKESFSRWVAHCHMTSEDMERKEFTRMVNFLRSVNIQPSYYDKNGKLHFV